MAESERKAPWDFDAERPDVAVLIALKEETLALREVVGQQGFHPRRHPTSPGHDYLLLAENERGRPYRVVLYFMDDMGPVAAASAAHRLLSMSPRLMVNIGIACSLHAGDLPLASVLVASQVDGYDERSKADDDGKGGWTWSFGGKVYTPTEEWSRIAGDLAVSHPESFAPWQAECASDFATLVDRARDGKNIEALRRRGFLPEYPVLQRGHLATGVSVAAASAFKKQVSSRDRNFKALEMEASGMLRAVREQIPVVDTLVLKGVSDLGDADKKRVDAIGPGAIRKAAMRNAVRLLWALMKEGLLQQGEPTGGHIRKPAAADDATPSRPVPGIKVDEREAETDEATAEIAQSSVSSRLANDTVSTPSVAAPSENDVIEALAKACDSGMADVLLHRIGYPRGRAPSFENGLVFWTRIVVSLPDVIGERGLRTLVEVAATLYEGNAVFKAFLVAHGTMGVSNTEAPTTSLPRSSSDRPPPSPGVVQEAPVEDGAPKKRASRSEWEQRLIEIIARKIDAEGGLLPWLGTGSRWSADAKRGSVAVAEALLDEDRSVVLIRGIRDVMIALLGAGASATRWAKVMNAVFFLALPVVAGRARLPRRRAAGRSWSIAADYPITAETGMAHVGKRPMELLEWRPGGELTPRAYITPDTPESGARLEQRVLDMKRDFESRRPVEAHDLIVELARGVLKVSGATKRKDDGRGRIINRAMHRVNDTRSLVDPSCVLTYYTILLDEDDRELAEMLASELERNGLGGLWVLVPEMQAHERDEDDELDHELDELRNAYAVFEGSKP